ncbi:MAG TPA: hypothetical protein PK857_00560 [Hyphomicrobium sp.]|nr:hypothetical protein [Hyphomicrobium sp.]HRO48768.1 hypothetical protein [Hyphomicrobium sp.]
MYIDKRLELSARQAISGTDPVPTTNTIDVGLNRNIGPGETMYAVIVVRTGLTGTSSPTAKVTLQTDDSDSFGSPAAIAELPAQAASAFVAGAMFVIPLPFKNEQFIRGLVTLTGTTPATEVDIFLTNQHPTHWKALPDGL